MTNLHSKAKVLVVGAFPSGRSQVIFGGQVTVCMLLLQSSFIDRYQVSTLDTTQISNPPPSFALRLLLAGIRFIKFIWMIICHRPDAAIFFFGDGASVIEKGLMARISQIFGVRSLVFPRAGGLIPRYFSNRCFATFVRHTLGKSDQFLCQGLSFQRFAIRELGLAQTSTRIIPNWTALDEHLKIGEQRLFHNTEDPPKILFMGWLEDFKGVFDLLEAVRILRDANVNFHLTFCGDGSASHLARHFVQLYGLDCCVTFAGWLDGAKRDSLLESNQIFVLPSWSEGLPNAMIEAMSAGLACVVTNVGMIQDYVINRRDALVVESKNPLQLANALREIINNESLRGEIGQNGFHLARYTFTLNSGADLLSDAVYKALNK